jgi:hypothetical protein
LNRLWIEGDGGGPKRYFHRGMVALNPAEAGRLEGGDSCVAASRAFAAWAYIVSWRTSDPWARLFGGTAVVAYRYELDCEADGQTLHLRGRDLMTLVWEEGRWQVVANHFSPEPGSAG